MIYGMNSTGIRQLLAAAAEALAREESRLNALDSAIGDGDHGITMRIGFEAVKQSLELLPPDSLPGQILTASGRTFMDSTGGAIGILLGRALTASGEAIHGRRTVGTPEWKLCFQAMEQAVASTGRAKPGDKTMLDAIHAVNQTLSTMEDVESPELLRRAADAAERAAEATASMRCQMGRASRLGDRALGHPDPGAVSFSVMTRALADRARDLTPEFFAGFP